ncbi:MAG: nucleoside monophosphate kinase [bacterium]|nr:nucleoside monophosphate kinase [bacterium]
MKNQRAVVIYGPPGSGKGTQAELLARKYGFIHFDTGRYIEGLIRSPQADRDPVLQRERANYEAGRLCTPEWVFNVTADEAARVADAGFSIVFSGSPRTMPEAFESVGKVRGKRYRGLVAVLVALYGKRNVSVVQLKVRPASSLKRNSSRRVCVECDLPVLGEVRHPRCGFCGSAKFRTRKDDDPKKILVRLEVYKRQTFPILAELRKRGVSVHAVNGEVMPYLVSRKINKKLGFL